MVNVSHFRSFWTAQSTFPSLQTGGSVCRDRLTLRYRLFGFTKCSVLHALPVWWPLQVLLQKSLRVHIGQSEETGADVQGALLSGLWGHAWFSHRYRHQWMLSSTQLRVSFLPSAGYLWPTSGHVSGAFGNIFTEEKVCLILVLPSVSVAIEEERIRRTLFYPRHGKLTCYSSSSQEQ